MLEKQRVRRRELIATLGVASTSGCLRLTRGDNETEPTTDAGSSTGSVGQLPFSEGFEDGTSDGWSEIWYPENEGGSRDILNDWSVSDETALSGDYSLRLRSVSDKNAIATDERILDLGADFTLEFEYYCGTENNRGPLIQALDTEQNGSKDGERVSLEDAHSLCRIWRHDAEDRTEYRLPTADLASEPGLVAAETTHTVRLTRRGSTLTLSHDGVEQNSADVGDLELDTSKRYRLVLNSSGFAGADSIIFWDSITFERTG